MQSDTAHLLNDLKQSDTVLPFEIIADPGQNIYRRLGINAAGSKEELLGTGSEQLKQKGAAARGAGFAHGDYEGNELQLPALFILDDQGTVLYSHYAEHLMDMPDVDGVLALLETLQPVS
jgi:peroxiredoxin